LIYRKILLVVLMFGIINFSFAKEPAQPKSTIQGTVLDSTESKPLEYANITIYKQNGNGQFKGTVTNTSGFFQLENIPAGEYLVKVNYMGFKADTIGVKVDPQYSQINLGNIKLVRKYLKLSGVQATAENISIDYRLDKKVLSVNRQQSSISGSAVEILENAPSITTDIEGNVELRGSSDFRVLINGQPTVQDANDVLQQTPASTIQKIEIITNPSAKYNPEGSAGIINLVLKRSRAKGVKGMVNANGGSYGRYGGEMLLNYNKNKIKTTLSLNYNRRPFPGDSWEERETTKNDTTTHIYQSGTNEWTGKQYGIRGTIEYLPNPVNTLKLALRVGGRGKERFSDNIFQKWIKPGPDQDTIAYDNTSKGIHGGDFYSLNLNHLHKFEGKGHQIQSNLNLGRVVSERQYIDKQFSTSDDIESGSKSVDGGPRNTWEFKIDYTLPLGKKKKFEAGIQNRGKVSKKYNENYEYSQDAEDFVRLSSYDHDVEYLNNISALYSLYSGHYHKLSYQAGMRLEYTDRNVRLLENSNEYNEYRWDLFPTLHISYKLAHKQELMLSYTRRIKRPRKWALEPFETWLDPYNIREGNPELDPQDINSLELGYKINFDRSFLSFESYYRNTLDKIEQVRSIHPQYNNVFLHSYDNVGEDHSLGSEVMVNLNLYPWWNLNLSGNLYNYRVVGKIDSESFDRRSFNWTTRISNTFNLGKSTRFQFNYSYDSPAVSSQGRKEDYYTTSASVRQNFLNNKFTAIFQVRDIFDTAEWEYKSEGMDFYMKRYFDRKAPAFSITLRYNINRYKDRTKKKQKKGEDFEGIEGEDF